jgi:AraC-like DNA-binding protein
MSGAVGLLRGPHAAEILGSVVACGLDQQQRVRVTDAFRSRALLRFIDVVDDLTTALRATLADVDIVILPAVDRDGHAGTVERVVRALALDRPRVAIVAYCPPGAGYSTQVRALATAGVHQFVFAGIDDYGATFRDVLATARRDCAASWVLRQLSAIVPPQLHRFVEAILAHPDRVTTVPALASELGVHRKTLFNWCERAAFLPPAELLAWTRLALVGYQLESTGCTVETIALELSYPSDTTLRNTIKRYTGLRASEIRADGGVARVLESFRRRVSNESVALHNR